MSDDRQDRDLTVLAKSLKHLTPDQQAEVLAMAGLVIPAPPPTEPKVPIATQPLEEAARPIAPVRPRLLLEQLTAYVEGEDRIRGILGEVVATLTVNAERGVITTTDPDSKQVLMDLIQRWRDQYENACKVQEEAMQPPSESKVPDHEFHAAYRKRLLDEGRTSNLGTPPAHHPV